MTPRCPGHLAESLNSSIFPLCIPGDAACEAHQKVSPGRELQNSLLPRAAVDMGPRATLGLPSKWAFPEASSH